MNHFFRVFGFHLNGVGFRGCLFLVVFDCWFREDNLEFWYLCCVGCGLANEGTDVFLNCFRGLMGRVDI